MFNQILINLEVPSPRCLLQAIEGFYQSANLMFLTRNLEARRLSHINFFLQLTIEKCTLNVHLVKFPSKLSCNGKKKTNCAHLGSRSKSLLVVNTIPLCKTPSNQSDLVLIQSTIYMILDFINPFTTDRFLPRRRIRKNPSVILLKTSSLSP